MDALDALCYEYVKIYIRFHIWIIKFLIYSGWAIYAKYIIDMLKVDSLKNSRILNLLRKGLKWEMR